jgi:hypothetical protein
MSNYKMVDVEKSISIQHEQFTRFKTAYDYLNKITFMINGMNIDLLVGDIVSIRGISRVTNLILTRICISSLLPKRHGGLRKRNLNSNVFILDAGNSTDVYQFVDFMKQYGLDIKKTLQKIIVSRVFTIYQLIHFLVYELSKIIRKYNINLVVIPDPLEMFIQDPQLRMKEAKSLPAKGPDRGRLRMRTALRRAGPPEPGRSAAGFRRRSHADLPRPCRHGPRRSRRVELRSLGR